MIRGNDNRGSIILGITRHEVEGLLDGKRCCFVPLPNGTGGPHICLWFAESDDDLLARLPEIFPDGVPTPIDYRTKVNP